MSEAVYINDEVFDKIDFKNKALPNGEYENCHFINCDFSNANLSEHKFMNCKFSTCNLSLANINHTTFQQIFFKDCKMLGLHFENANQFGLAFNFEQCKLDHSSFYQTKIKKTIIKNCTLHHVDFTDCDLTGALLTDCDCSNAKFENTTLEKADLRGSYNFSINPNFNKIKKAKFSLAAVPGLLDVFDIKIEA